MSGYGSARVKATAAPPVASKQVHARQRLVVGLLAGLVAQFVVALILGFLLAGGLSLQVRILNTLISSVIATPAVMSAGFALMLKDDARSFGGGIVGGALAGTLLLGLLALVL